MKPRNSTLASRSDGHPTPHRQQRRIPTTSADAISCDSYNFKGGHHTVRHPALLGAIRCIFDFGYNDWSQDILAVRPPAHNARIVAQSGYFTLHPKGRRLLEETSVATLQSYRIPSASKKAIRRELGLMNFNEFTVYGDLDHLASWLRAEYTKKTFA